MPTGYQALWTWCVFIVILTGLLGAGLRCGYSPCCECAFSSRSGLHIRFFGRAVRNDIGKKTNDIPVSMGNEATAHLLVCFTCSDASSNWGCLASTTCQSSENYCVTTYLGAGIGGQSGPRITKECASECSSHGISYGRLTEYVSCCSSFLCNISGANSVKISYSVLAMEILASFIYIRAGL
nr:lymphocyte antigen 6E-like [Caretta caretta]